MSRSDFIFPSSSDRPLPENDATVGSAVKQRLSGNVEWDSDFYDISNEIDPAHLGVSPTRTQTWMEPDYTVGHHKSTQHYGFLKQGNVADSSNPQSPGSSYDLLVPSAGALPAYEIPFVSTWKPQLYATSDDNPSTYDTLVDDTTVSVGKMYDGIRTSSRQQVLNNDISNLNSEAYETVVDDMNEEDDAKTSDRDLDIDRVLTRPPKNIIRRHPWMFGLAGLAVIAGTVGGVVAWQLSSGNSNHNNPSSPEADLIALCQNAATAATHLGMQLLNGIFSGSVQQLQSVCSAINVANNSCISLLTNNCTELASTQMSLISGNAQPIYGFLQEVATTLNALTTTTTALPATISSTMSSAVTAATSSWVATAIANSSIASTTMTALESTVSTTASSIASTASTVASTVAELTTDALSSVASTASSAFVSASSTISTLASTTSSAASTALTSASTALSSVTSSVWSTITSTLFNSPSSTTTSASVVTTTSSIQSSSTSSTVAPKSTTHALTCCEALKVVVDGGACSPKLNSCGLFGGYWDCSCVFVNKGFCEPPLSPVGVGGWHLSVLLLNTSETF